MKSSNGAAKQSLGTSLRSEHEEGADGASHDEEDKTEDEDDVEDVWVEEKDKDGNIYYFNDTTGESTWDKPNSSPKEEDV